jgi:hypothetical protein
VNDAKELAALDKRISEEKTKNCYLQRELDILKQERTREVRLLKKDQGRPPLPSSTFSLVISLGC